MVAIHPNWHLDIKMTDDNPQSPDNLEPQITKETRFTWKFWPLVCIWHQYVYSVRYDKEHQDSKIIGAFLWLTKIVHNLLKRLAGNEID